MTDKPDGLPSPGPRLLGGLALGGTVSLMLYCGAVVTADALAHAFNPSARFGLGLTAAVGAAVMTPASLIARAAGRHDPVLRWTISVSCGAILLPLLFYTITHNGPPFPFYDQ